MSEFPEVIAHRGFKGKAPENTIAAFMMAAELPIDGIELDVQMSRDARLVVIHDEKLGRTTNGRGLVREHTFRELRELDAGSWFSGKYAGERIPSLEEVFELLKDYKFTIHVELKTSLFEYEGIEKLVAELIDKFRMNNRVIVSSFNHYSLKRMKQAKPEVRTAVINTGNLFEPGEYLKSIGAEDIHTSMYTINGDLIGYTRVNSIKLRCFTANQEWEMVRLVNMGVDGIFTDNPDVLLNLKRSPANA